MGVHLDECFEIASNSSHTRDDLYDCLYTWGIKTRTAFHEDERLILPWWFGALCLTFSVSGVGMLMIRPKWSSQGQFPYTFYALMLIFVQGPLSFLADYVHMTHESNIHAIDRFVAVFLMSLETARIVFMSNKVNNSTMVFSVLAYLFALVSFLMSQIAQTKTSTSGFIFWHALWHTYPILAFSTLLFDKFVIGELDAPRSNVMKSEMTPKKQGVELLSSVVMKEQLMHTSKPCNGVKCGKSE